MKELRIKCWVEDDGEKFYGPGPNELIKKIQKEGSLSRAASEMNMSYKKAWDLIQRLNQHAEKPLVILKKGGSHGGGAEVTEYAREIVAEYDQLEKEIARLIEKQNLLKVLK
ncbi:winged helix-turn-helix domain-containing protein [Christiangramia sp. SM2212]|uniref:Winged helix-turn-helix domain-containing protein n=1 Tax=Christiangramia sediminicola TaxID=3073267 RepID=A0ABU1EQ48_9FLAO|nr:winged helix-turn-helix domain-containing protein [Christiangramia sp. SM2212]MDR5590512.1 winged helix-turn-helix domain-containing protein [Christiangramia sp. SM2212]